MPHPPAREFLFFVEKAAEAGDAILELAARQERRLVGLGQEEAAAQLASRVGEHVEKMLLGIYFEGIEQYKPFFYRELHTLLSYVRHGAVVLDEPIRLREQFTAARREIAEAQARRWRRGGSCRARRRSRRVGRPYGDGFQRRTHLPRLPG